ncbi:hypothetical protein FBF35_07555 [Schaalia odontolytica]|nr:hypothetical protein [Schaalia odontolytica]QCT35833.1 hypothetical protein FBF35_07315 [Schaalia odontolytica]QCT35878.1 hypothetical protein FBF35_07555 [Schaalia odontolytica]
MMTRYIAVYFDTAQVQALRDDAQETVLAADEDLEITKQLNDLTARRLAREAIDKKRDLYVEIVDKLQEASERLNVGEGDYIDE